MATTYHGRVQTEGVLKRGHVNLRQQEKESSTSLALIDDGTELEVTLGSSKKWFKTTYAGKTGYVSAAYIAITEGTLYRVNVNEGTLNVRETPTDDAIFTAAKDRGLYVLQTSGDWCLVSCNIGTGWASKKYLVQDSTVVPFDYPTVDEFIERLKGFCGKGWSYKLGYSSTGKTIDCANYPYVARYSLGAHNVTDEYKSIDEKEKGGIIDRSQLQVGMEVFQPDSTGGLTHMGVYAGLVNFNGETLHAVYQSRSRTGTQKAMYSEPLGPNLTEMNDNWKYWGWSKYVKH